MPSLAQSSAWPAALAAFDRDLTRRAVAEKTRLAYASDCRQFAALGHRPRVEPARVDIRALRRYAAGLSEQGIAPATIARRLAALRGLFRSRWSSARAQRTRPSCSARRRSAAPAAGAEGRRGGGATRVDSRDDAARAPRPSAVRARLRVRPARRGVGVARPRVDRLRLGECPGRGQGRKTRLVPVGEHALGALERYLARARPALTADGEGRATARCSSRNPAGGCRPPTSGGASAAGRGARWAARRRLPGPSARAPALVRNPPARRRSGPAGDPGTPRPCDHIDHSGLHSR